MKLLAKKIFSCYERRPALSPARIFPYAVWGGKAAVRVHENCRLNLNTMHKLFYGRRYQHRRFYCSN